MLERAGTYLAISYLGSGVFMVEGTLGRERGADIGVGKERERRIGNRGWRGKARNGGEAELERVKERVAS